MDDLSATPPAPSLASAKALQIAGDFAAAEAQFRALMDLAGGAEALQGLGLTRFQQGDAAGALDLLRAAQALSPDSRTAYNVAVALGTLNRAGEAVAILRGLIGAHPDYLPPYHLAASLLEASGDAPAAAEIIHGLLQMAMTAGDAGVIRQTAARLAGLDVDPPQLLTLANRLRLQGHSDQAIALLQARLSRAPDDLAARLVLAMSRLTIVHADEAEIETRRDAYARDLTDLARIADQATPEALAAGARAVGDTKPFYLSYHGLNDRALQEAYGQVVTRMIAASARSLPSALLARRTSPRRLRVGFATGYFHIHSVSKLFGGWVRHLDRQRFEVFGYDLGQGDDACSRALSAACDHIQRGFADHQQAFEAMAGDLLDVIIYPEIGMHPLAVQLACRRLAPVQCVAWGHPVTTGLPHIDYFLTSDLMEPVDGQDAYTERLVRLPNLSIHYDPLPSEGGLLGRIDLGLSADAVVYVCCQSLFKYLPRYDDVFARIAAQVPQAQFLFIGDPREPVAAAVRARLGAAFAATGLDAERHLVFAAPVPAEAFPSLLRAGDIYLDSIGWSGGNTTLEAVACDLPIVTLPTDLMRGRHSAAILQMMGLDHAVSPTLEAYVERAVALAEPIARAAARDEIVAQRDRLYGDIAPVRALEDFLIAAAGPAACDSEPVPERLKAYS